MDAMVFQEQRQACLFFIRLYRDVRFSRASTSEFNSRKAEKLFSVYAIGESGFYELKGVARAFFHLNSRFAIVCFDQIIEIFKPKHNWEIPFVCLILAGVLHHKSLDEALIGKRRNHVADG